MEFLFLNPIEKSNGLLKEHSELLKIGLTKQLATDLNMLLLGSCLHARNVFWKSGLSNFEMWLSSAYTFNENWKATSISSSLLYLSSLNA